MRKRDSLKRIYSEIFEKTNDSTDRKQSASSRRGSRRRRSAFRSDTYLDHWDIKQHAIQILHTDTAEKQSLADLRDQARWPFFEKALHPNGKFRRSFDFVTVLWVMLIAFTIPFEIGFSWYVMPQWYKIFSKLLDVWFALDIILNFRTGYILHGTVVMNERKICSHYFSTWFAVDLLGTFPFELLLNPKTSSRKSLKLVKYFKIPKLMRLSRVLKYVHVHKQVYDIFEVLVFVMSFLHFGSCIWVRVVDPCPDEYTAFGEDDICSQNQILHAYSQILHMSAVMILGISNSHIVLESGKFSVMVNASCSLDSCTRVYFMSTLFMVFGLFLVALLIGKMNVYIMGRMQGSAAFQQRSDRVKHEMEYYAIPDELQTQVKAFYNYVWVHQKQYDDRIALLSDDQMSTDLQRKLALHLYKDVVSHISFFSEIDDLMLGEICLSLRTRIFLPKDMILFKDDVGRELFIISKGVVEVLRDDLPPSKRFLSPPILLRKGSFFGEIALIMETRRTCSVQARTVCELNVLHQDTFDNILRNHPSFARRMNELVVVRQLESCLERAKYKGIDVKVSKEDMDKAIDLVEKNMTEGLIRRSVTGNFRQQVFERQVNKVGDLNKECPQTSHLRDVPSTSNDCKRSASVADIFNEITERSKHLSDGQKGKISTSSDACMTNAEEEANTDIEEGDHVVEEFIAEGHYVPGQQVPIEMVRSSILNAPEEESTELKDKIIRTILPVDVIEDPFISGIDERPKCKLSKNVDL